MNVYLASDHGGFHLKQVLAAWLRGQGRLVEDLGPVRLDPDDDYPPFAAAVAERISLDPSSRGILLCRSGQGVAIVANKFPGVRAALAWNVALAQAARADDDANILSLPADLLTDRAAQAIVQAFLTTPFRAERRFTRRLEEIRRIEERTMKRTS